MESVCATLISPFCARATPQPQDPQPRNEGPNIRSKMPVSSYGTSSLSDAKGTMSSYLSNLLTQTTTRYKTIRQNLLPTEDDGDTEDDSHISRVLRAYYSEKGRPFPPWLPPDPNDRRSITPQPYAQPSSGYFNNTGGRGQVAAVQNQNQPGARSSLSDLWDPPAQNNAPMQPQSLRNARRPGAPSQPTSNPSSNLAPPPQARPLPSQRAGSYQSIASQQSGRPSFEPTPPSSSGGGTAQDRLKARLYGGGGNRTPGQSPYEPPAGQGGSYFTGGRSGR